MLCEIEMPAEHVADVELLDVEVEVLRQRLEAGDAVAERVESGEEREDPVVRAAHVDEATRLRRQATKMSCDAQRLLAPTCTRPATVIAAKR